MPNKTFPGAQKSKRPFQKKTNVSRLIFIIIAVIIVLIFLVFSIYSSKRNNREVQQPSAHSKSSPAFRKDGHLSILKAGNSKPISVDIEIADNDDERMQGLMYRQSLAENAGMLFIFNKEEPRSFWMKNTFIPLDIIYINSRKEIVSIQKYTQPRSTYSIPSDKPAMYVLEVNAGFADKNGIKPGDKIDFSR